MTPLYAAALFGHLEVLEFFISNGAEVNEEHDNGRIPLHVAAINGNMKIMEYLIQQGSGVNKADRKGGTPFNAAIQYGHLDAVKYLMAKGAKQNRYDGMTPLYAAAQFGHSDIVKFFILNGADANEEHEEGMIPLHGAASGGHLDIMEYLIQEGSDMNKACSKGWTPFNAAIQYGHLDAVKYLIDKGAKQSMYAGMTPLYIAAQAGHLDIVQFLVSNGADVNEVDDKGMISLHAAARKDNIEIVEYLIQQGSDVNKADSEGWTPFNAAIQGGNLETVKYLIDKGAKQNRYDGMTPLYMAAQAGHLDVVQLLISNDADVNEVDDEGMIAIHAVAHNGNIEIVEYFIQQGSDLNKADINGLTPLNAAIIEGQLKVVKFLIAKGANYFSYEGMTPLYIATQYDHIDVVKFLVSKGVSVNEGTEGGKSPLHAACYNGNTDILEYLLLNNADVNQQDRDGWTPLQAAVQEGYQHVSDYLLVHGAQMKDSDDFASIHTSPNTGHYTLEGILNKHQFAEDETREQEQNDHQTAMKAECATASMTDTEKQSYATHTQKSKPHVQSIHNGNTFNQANVEDERCAELSLRALSTGAYKAEDRANQELNPFSGAQTKSPEKSEHGSSQDDIDAVQNSMTTKQYNRANDTSRPVSLGPQKWQYSGFGPPFLQTLNNSMTTGQNSEDPWSRWHLPTEEIGQTRNPPSLITARNDRVIHGASSESNRTLRSKPSSTGHQDVYYKKHLSYIEATSGNAGLKFLSKFRNTWKGRPPSALLIVETLLHALLAFAIILAGCPVHVAGNRLTEEVTLQAGSQGVVPFNFPWSTNDTSQGVPYFTVQFESQNQPFCVNGMHVIDGFKSSTQSSRYTTSVTGLDTAPCVNLFIDDVDTVDQDKYIFNAIWHSLGYIRHEVIKKEVVVKVPPGSAKCFITLSDNCAYGEVHCRATTGTVAASLSCYQNDQKLNILADISDSGQTTSGTFCLLHDTAFSCCSHEVTSDVSGTTCNDFQWPPREPAKRTTRQNIPVSLTDTSISSPTYTNLETSQMTQIEFDIDSGAGRQKPSLFKYFLYPLINVLHFVY
nr:ankyrin repeat domain-containing protein 50-like [Lytechinus pictus]